MKEYIYFLGIGGIGMSALARYFLHEGRRVAGYDRTHTPLTEQLEAEGAAVHYEDDAALIPAEFRDPARVLVVYTPAVPAGHPEMVWFAQNGFTMVKRSQMLGEIARGKFVMAVAGTHGKTSTTTLTAWLNAPDGSAFMGGISKNFGTNLVLGRGDRLAVEADEFDRSFLTLHPDVAVITSTDPDHLDIYGTAEAMREAFAQFACQVRRALVVKHDAVLELPTGVAVWRYGLTEGDMHAEGIELREGGYYNFDIVLPDRVVCGCTLGIPGLVNVENAVAAVALQWVSGGFDEARIKAALASFAGVKRRFDFWINTSERVYIDDYAHHPRELAAAIGSLRRMFPDRRLTAVFQPHLYTRTRDFHREFGAALSQADEVILAPIYPAREQPIAGVDSSLIGASITVPWTLIPRDEVPAELACRAADASVHSHSTEPAHHRLDVVATFGAGDIENICPRIAEVLHS